MAVKKEQMRDWVFDKIENTKLTFDTIQQMFIKEFGKDNLNWYERFVDEYMN